MDATNLPEQRRARIVEMLHAEGKVTPRNLSQRLDVSIDTIRRDLIQLEHAGQLTKVHGGALPPSPAAAPYPLRKKQNNAEKLQLAHATAQLIQPGQLIFMDSGTTIEETARQLPLDLNATVVTTSLPVAEALAAHTQLRIILPGGTLNPTSMSLSGSMALAGLRHIRADVCLLGVCSLDINAGLTCTDIDEVAIKQTLIQNAQQLIVPITRDKLGTAAPFGIADADRIDRLVITSAATDEQLLPYRNLNIQIEGR